MKLEEFMKFIRTQKICDYIVRLQYKYNHEDTYTITNEYLYADPHRSGINYTWFDDWNEGYEDINVLGYIAVDEITMPKLETYHGGFTHE